jgi:arylsulfatase A-like enzyme
VWKHTGTLAVLLALIGTLSYSAEDGLAQTGSPERRPNILFVFSDDMDTYTLKRAMPKTEALIGDKGTIFPKALFAQPTCCPSRAAMQRGQYPHNTRVWDNVAPQGFQAFYENGLHKETYATVLDEAGYKTGYFGKYLNGYGGWTVPKKRADGTYDDTLAPLIPAWDKWRVSLGPPVSGVYKFEDGSIGNFERDTYGLPDRLATLWAERFIRGASASQGEHPFAAVVSLHGPPPPGGVPEARALHHDVRQAQLPKPPSFDEADRSDKPKAVRNLSKIDAEEKRELTLYNRERLRSAAYADNLTVRLLATLDESGELEGTLVVFWSDNGYHLGQHALEARG